MDLQTLFEYYHQSNKDYIEFIAAQKQLPERARVLMSHVLNAQAIWIDRMMEEDQPRFGVWERHQDHLLLPIQNSLIEATNYIFRKVPLDKITIYTNSQGKQFQNKVEDILFHILNHGTHHRAQLAMIINREGLKAPSNDYIFRMRKEIL